MEAKLSVQFPSQNYILEIAAKKTRKSRYQSNPVLSNFIGFIYFVPNMLSKIVEELVDTEVKKFIEWHVDRVKERRIE